VVLLFSLLLLVGILIAGYWAYIVVSHFLQRRIDKKATEKFNEYLRL